MAKPACFLFLVAVISRQSFGCDLSADSVAETMGVKPTVTPDGTVRVAWPT